MITELCEAGELAKLIKKQGPFSENASKVIMRQIVDAISYLHKNGEIENIYELIKFKRDYISVYFYEYL